MTTKRPFLLLVLLAVLLATATTTAAYSIGGLLFRATRSVRYVKSSDYDALRRMRSRTPTTRREEDGKGGEEDALELAGKFFVDAFWRGKAGAGGDATAGEELSPSQSRAIGVRQIAEFRKRYGGAPSSSSGGGSRLPGNYAARSPPPPSSGRRRAELVLCVDPSSGWSILGCAGIEISDVRKMDGYDGKIRGVPVMSNLAVGRGCRRLGLAGGLVRAAEDLASREWGCGACYLYVEGRNRPALRLYEKLGYVKVWEDGDATTLLPSGGGLTSGRTTIVCMKKELGGGMFGNLFRR